MRSQRRIIKRISSTESLSALSDESKAKPKHFDVPGAPFRIGEQVLVAAGADDTFDNAFSGLVGVVAYLEYDCGCGQTYPYDPMIGVRFEANIEEFWAEELRREEIGTSMGKHV